MDYISVKDAASKFSISKRRIQQLCEAGRFDGAQMISGVWVIPADAEKPADDRVTTVDPNRALISLNDLCKMLSISVATGRNWIKLGKITPQNMIKKTAFFTPEYVESLKENLKKGDNKTLKSRRNKKYISGNNIYNSYVSESSVAQKHVQDILNCIAANNIAMDELAIRTLVAECAVQLLLHDTVSDLDAIKEPPAGRSGNHLPSIPSLFSYAGNCLESYLKGSLSLNGYDFLIDDLIIDKKGSLQFIQNHPELFQISYQYEGNVGIAHGQFPDCTAGGPSTASRDDNVGIAHGQFPDCTAGGPSTASRDDKEDILGLLYISIRNLGTRKATGSYYTPTKVVRKLCGKLFEKNSTSGKRFLDPCCGTGNFLLQLPDEIPFENIHGNDTDLISILITRINLAIKYGVKDKKKLYSQITNEDYLNHSFTGSYDFIIGNPPWGYEFSEEEKGRLRDKYASAIGANIEAYDVFIEQAFADLSNNGVLSFVLPEALLNVKMHMPVRRLLMQQSNLQYLDYLGNVFDKVQCPCIILQAQYTDTPLSCIGMEVCDSNRSFQIKTNRKIDPECFSFQTTDEEYSVLKKIENPEEKRFLADNAIFALGIVTGNNKAYISAEKNEFNEIVLKGSDLCKYRFKPSTNYIVFQPEAFQQIAPTKYYRAPEKLLYRFICNQLVFAYDNQQTLSLNSCNLVIPKIEGLSMKYILAILNSRAAQYYFKKTFHSVKILKSHIEQIPIPYIDQEQQEDLLADVEEILASVDDANIIYNRLDKKISALYGLSDMEYQTILESMKNENLFLK